MKKLHKAIIISIFIISLGANLYYFGTQELKKREQKAFSNGVIYTFQKAIEVGEVSLKVEDKTIILKLQ
ncbi:hypothetical protein GQ568_03470 [Patescibacteria group bacterium]|nr:hypothetical protein [Patescibacteria group bacterium]